MSRKRADGVEAVLRKADTALDDWFRRSRITTQQASRAFGRFLARTKRQGAGALRGQVVGLQAGLKKLSSGLEHMERQPKTTRTPRRSPARRKPTRARKPRKAA
jgi:dsDNA-binding SOS-regulon protein